MLEFDYIPQILYTISISCSTLPNVCVNARVVVHSNTIWLKEQLVFVIAPMRIYSLKKNVHAFSNASHLTIIDSVN